MFILRVVLLISSICINCHSESNFSVSLGVYKPDEKVQDQKGQEASDPYSPALAIGYIIPNQHSIMFSPRIGYIRNTNTSEDTYGPYTVDTFFLLYDFIWLPSLTSPLRMRFGVGNFIKRVSGDGGTVTVPNGTGTATSQRPSGTKSSYTGALNLGADLVIQNQGSWLSGYGLSGEVHIFELLNSRKTYTALQLSLLGFF